MPMVRPAGGGPVELDIMLKGKGKIYSRSVDLADGEIVVPISKLGVPVDAPIYFNAIATQDGKSTPFSNADEAHPRTWQHIRLER